jgi:DNA-binding transcriptional regulator/RsmH inhibitor MraZ
VELILIIRERASFEQVEQMLQTLRIYIKVVVDIERCILAGGGRQHADCEAELLLDGSNQRDIWGAN